MRARTNDISHGVTSDSTADSRCKAGMTCDCRHPLAIQRRPQLSEGVTTSYILVLHRKALSLSQ